MIQCALLCVLTATSARASGTDPSTADSLFREGRRAADVGNYAVACAKFEESNRLDPAPGTLLNLADCEENLGQLALAGQLFRELYDQLTPSDPRQHLAEVRARELEARTPKLQIVLVSAVPATVTRDDTLLGPASLGIHLPVDPGLHVVVVSSPGRQDKRYEVRLSERQDSEITVAPGDSLPLPATGTVLATAGPPVAPQPGPSAVDMRAGAADHEANARSTAAFVLGGLGVASVLAGGTLGVVALSLLGSSNASCTGNVCSNQEAINQYRSAQSFALAADVTLGVGLACLGTAVVMVATGHRGDAARETVWSPMGVAGHF